MSKQQRIGALRHRIKIYERTRTDDGLGGSTISDSLVKELWSLPDYKTIQGTVGASGQQMDVNQIDFIVRAVDVLSVDASGYRTFAIRQGQYVEFEGRKMDVKAAANYDSEARFMRIVTHERPVG